MANEPSTEVATKKDLKGWLSSDSFKLSVSEALPRHVSADRFVRLAITASNKTPLLAKCTVPSILQCLMDLSAMGLEPDGRRAHLIPFKRKKQIDGKWQEWYECQLIVDYKGLAELAYRSGNLAQVPRAEIVCENDEFEWVDGVVHHKINYRQPRGDMYAVYSCVLLKGASEPSFCVMTLDEVEGIRARSKAKDSGPWVTDFFEMAKKTAFRRHSKWLPLSSEFHDADRMDYDNLADADSVTEQIRTPSRPLFGSRTAELPEPTSEPIDIPAEEEREPVPVETQEEIDARQLREQLAKEQAEGLFPAEEKKGGKR